MQYVWIIVHNYSWHAMQIVSLHIMIRLEIPLWSSILPFLLRLERLVSTLSHASQVHDSIPITGKKVGIRACESGSQKLFESLYIWVAPCCIENHNSCSQTKMHAAPRTTIHAVKPTNVDNGAIKSQHDCKNGYK